MSLRLLIPCCLVLLLTGCQSDMRGALQTLQTAALGAEQPSGARLDPRFAYLRVTMGKKIAFLALGYVEPDSRGPIEVWYSAEREVIRLQNGRLVGAAGTLTEWREVRMPDLPSWRELANRRSPYAWSRVRDVMPGYQYNIQDQLTVVPIAPLHNSRVVGIAPESLTWFEESLQSAPAHPALNLPPARYAVAFSADAARVVYAEQCISIDICLTWQRWVAGQ